MITCDHMNVKAALEIRAFPQELGTVLELFILKTKHAFCLQQYSVLRIRFQSVPEEGRQEHTLTTIYIFCREE